MKKINLIGLASILGVSIASCANVEAQCCSTKENDDTKNIKSNTMKNDSLKSDFNLNEPLVCLLIGEEFTERKEMLQKEIFSQVKKAEEIEDGYIFHFKYEEAFLMKMTDYVIAENNCCPFFTFEIKLHAKNDIYLKVTGPKQAKEMIKMELINKK